MLTFNNLEGTISRHVRVPAELVSVDLAVHQRQCVAWHERNFGRYQQVLDLEHYLEVLERKPGALAGSRPLQQWRERGRWPESFDRLWHSLEQRHGRAAGTRAMIELLSWGKQQGWDRLKSAIEEAQRLDRCLYVRDHAIDSRCLQLLRAVKEEPGCRKHRSRILEEMGKEAHANDPSYSAVLSSSYFRGDTVACRGADVN